MKYFILMLLVMAQTACVGTNKPRPDIALYDFGYAIKPDTKPLLAKTDIEQVTANTMLNYPKMRYRLEYINPARVFYFTESRWIAPPADLINNQLNMLVQTGTKPLNCNLKLNLQVFDQVFNSKENSVGVVQINAILMAKNNKQLVANEVINESVSSKSSNAESGARALAKASENALVKAVNWANTQAEQNAICNN